MPAVTWVHLVGAGVAAGTAVTLVVSRRRSGLPLGYLALAAAGAVPWCLSAGSASAEGLHPWHQVLWMPSVAWTAGALLLWALTIARYRGQPSRAAVACCLGTPVLLLVVRAVGGTDTRVPIFVVNTLYSFLLMLAIAVTVAARRRDPNPAVRAIVGIVFAGAVGALVSEALRLEVTDLAAAAGIAGAAVGALAAGPALVARPEAELLLDDLGALVFVFDDRQRLIDLNAPARLFYEARGAAPPSPGTTAAAVVGGDLDAVDTISVDLVAGADRIGMRGYAQRLPHSGSPARGWVVLLRRTVDRSGGLDRQSARRAALRLVQRPESDGG